MLKQKNSAKIISVLFVCAVVLMLLLGLARTIFSPMDAVEYENRPASKLSPFSFSSYLSGDFQDSMEAALSDQVPFAIKSKKLYNIFDYHAAAPVIASLADSGMHYIRYRDIYFYDGILLHAPSSLASQRSALERKAQVLTGYFSSCPDTDFAVYYIESDLDINFDTGENMGHCDFLASLLSLPAANFGALRLNGIADYSELFLYTDHHWNGRGSRQALEDVCAMLGVDMPAVLGEYTAEGRYLGTKAAGIEGLPPEDFTVTVYDLPDIEVYASGSRAPSYGLQREFVAGELETFSYGSVFGPDGDEVLFKTGKRGENLLVLGDSYDNAILLPLASCFANTYSVDLRGYSSSAGVPFDIASYVAEHEIDKVLIIGALEYFNGSSS